MSIYIFIKICTFKEKVQESSGKIHTTLITLIPSGEENKTGREGKSLVLILHTSRLFDIL